MFNDPSVHYRLSNLAQRLKFTAFYELAVKRSRIRPFPIFLQISTFMATIDTLYPFVPDRLAWVIILIITTPKESEQESPLNGCSDLQTVARSAIILHLH